MPTASETRRPEDALDDALSRALLWREVALGLFPPQALVPAAAADDADAPALAQAVARLELPPFARADEPLAARFAALFGHTVRASICPYETEYGDGRLFRQTQELADLEGWYAAFGLARNDALAERADHLGVECEFAGFLCLKEAFFLQAGDGEQVEIVRQAYRRFLRDHLAHFGVAVCTRIEQADRGGFYARLALLCRELLLAECRRLDLDPGPRALPLRDAEEEVPAACGADAECASPECEGASPLGRAAPRRLLSIGGR